VRCLQKSNTHTRTHRLALTCGTEEESLRLSQVLEDLVGDGHLGVGEGAEHLLVRGAHVVVDVVEE